MKKIFFALALFLAFGSNQNLEAQGYIRAGAGAGFGVTKDAFAIPAVTYDTNNIAVSQNTIFGSFGQGARYSLAGGYMITPYFGVELEVYYFQGFKQDYGSDIRPQGTDYKRTGYSYQIRTIPSLVVQATEGKFQPYARFGVLIPVFGQTIIEESYAYTGGTSREKQTDVDGKFSVGFESSMGLQYNITDNLGVYVQATYTGLRIKSDKATITKDNDIDADGNISKDNLKGAKRFLTEIVFQDQMDENSNYFSALSSQLPSDIIVKIAGSIPNFDADKPLNLPTQTSNFAALSFSLGVKYTFGNN